MRTRLKSPDLYTIGWIAALPIERAAATALLEERHGVPEGFHQHRSDANSYTWGRIGEHNIVIASLSVGVYGLAAAATTASDLIHSLPHIRIGLLVGIGGGIARPNVGQDIRLGDIVVSQPDGTTGGVVQYDLGKAKANGAWERKGSLDKPPAVLLHALASLQAEHEIAPSRIPDLLQAMWEANPHMSSQKNGYTYQGAENDRLFESHRIHAGGGTCDKCDSAWEVKRDRRESTDPEIHYGIIASGDKLIKDAATRDSLSEDTGQQCLCVEMEAAGLMDRFPCLVIRGICDYADSHKNDRWQRYAAATAAAFAVELLGFVPTGQLETTQKVIEVMQSLEKKVTTLSTFIQNVDYNIALDKLPVAEGASFDSSAEEHNPTCLPNTRVELLDDITRWVDDPMSKPIFWLNGMAGTGKSTISRTVARLRSQSGDLGASFFFRRGETDRGNLAKFCPTLARQLAVSVPALSPHIKDAIDADPVIGGKAVREQFDKLVLGPLSKTPQNLRSASLLVIVIDALDECERDADISLLIDLFSHAQSPQLPRLRLFVTSRPELPICLGFSAIKGTYQDLILHEIPAPIVEHDISTFLKHELGTIRDNFNLCAEEERKLPPDWPGESNLQALVTMAIPLFIFAATVCRFIGDWTYGNPNKQLQKVLCHMRESHGSKLDMTYSPALKQQLTDKTRRERQEIIDEFRLVVGTIITLASPLPTRALALMLDVPPDTVADRLRMLHSVLRVPATHDSPVRLLHLSFRDYLIDPENKETNEFWVDEELVHRNLAKQCLRIMCDGLCENICNIQTPGTCRSSIDPKQITTCLPPELQYTCLYWVHHRTAVDPRPDDTKEVHDFFAEHFLHWLETMSLMGRTTESLAMLKSLQDWLKHEQDQNLSDFIADAVRFVLTNFTVIDEAPLQVYSSALVFAPTKSVVRRMFEINVPRWISLWPHVEENWDACLSTLEGHSGSVDSVAFSHDSKLVASASDDKTVRIWSVEMGKCEQVLEGHSQEVNSVVFSHDSNLVASASFDKTVRIWSVETGKCERVLEGHSDWVKSVVFSHDSKLVASASNDEKVRIWSVETGKCAQVLDGHGAWVSSAVFSHDSKLVASASHDKTVRIWSVDTGKCEQVLEGYSSKVFSVVFSHDSKLVAPASYDKTVRIWSVETGKCEYILKGHSDSVRSVVFSHDSKLVASASQDKTVRIWSVETGKCERVLEGHSGSADSVAFSHDSKLVASASHDKTVRIWSVETGNCEQVLEGHGLWVESVVFSHDSKVVASASGDETVRIWSVEIGKCEYILKGHSDSVRSVVFSHDSNLVASASQDKTVRIWSVETGNCEQVLEGHSGGVESVVFSHDSKLVASASDDEKVRIWSVETGKCDRVIHLGNGTQQLYFETGAGLVTDAGVISMTHESIYSANSPTLTLTQSSSHSVLELSIDDNISWISYRGKGLFWLPAECRHGRTAISGNSVVIGCESGRLVLLTFSSGELTLLVK